MNRYITWTPRLNLFNEAERRVTAMPFIDWQRKAQRSWVDVSEDDGEAVGQMICWISRPSRPEISLRHLHAFGNAAVINETGKPHPRFSTHPRKKKSEVDAVFKTLDRLFRRGLRAGRALEHAWSDCLQPKEFGAALTAAAPEIFNGSELPASSDERKKLWSDFIPMVHLAMTMRLRMIEVGLDVDSPDLRDGDLTRDLLSKAPLDGWVKRVLIEAEEWSYRIYYQQLVPHPERMVHLNLRAKDMTE